MASQAEKDTAAAKAKQGGGQTAIDTAAAKAKQNNNNQAAKDTARAKSRQNGGDGGTSARMSQREAAAGLYLAGNDTISAGRGGSGPSFAQREAAAGLTNTMSGRVASRAANPDFPPVGTPLGNDEFFVTQNVAGGGGGGGEFSHEVIQLDDTKIKVRYGQVANIDTSGTNPDISLATEYTVGNDNRIFIKVTVNQGTAQPSAAEIHVSTSVPSDSAGTAYLQLAQVLVEDGKITNIAQTASGSFRILSCASVHIFSKI